MANGTWRLEHILELNTCSYLWHCYKSTSWLFTLPQHHGCAHYNPVTFAMCNGLSDRYTMRVLAAKPQLRLYDDWWFVTLLALSCRGKLESTREFSDRTMLQLVGIYHWRNLAMRRSSGIWNMQLTWSGQWHRKRIPQNRQKQTTVTAQDVWKHKNYIYIPADSGETARGQLMEQSGVLFPLHTAEATWRTLTLMDSSIHVRGIILSQQTSKTTKRIQFQWSDCRWRYGTKGAKVRMDGRREGNFINTRTPLLFKVLFFRRNGKEWDTRDRKILIKALSPEVFRQTFWRPEGPRASEQQWLH